MLNFKITKIFLHNDGYRKINKIFFLLFQRGGDGIWPPTQPLVTVENITIQNLTSKNALFFKYGAGVSRCNVSNPCRFFNF